MRQSASDWPLSPVSRTTGTKRKASLATQTHERFSSRQSYQFFRDFFIISFSIKMEKEDERNEKIAENNVTGAKKEDAFAKIVFSDHEESSGSRKVQKEPSVEGAATCGPEQGSGLKSISDQLLPHGHNAAFKTDSSTNGGFLGLNPETPKRENPGQEEQEDPAAADPENQKAQHEDALQLLRELSAERDEARQLNRQLQIKLAGYFHNGAIDGGRLERDRSGPEGEQLQEYEKCVQILSELKQQLRSASETAQQQAEQLRSQAQEKLDKAEEEWEALMALKRDAAVAALSRRLGKEPARSKVKAVLAAERLRQAELTKLRLKHFKLSFRIRRLEAELREGAEHGEDPLQVQFEQLRADMLERKKQAEKEGEEALKLQKKIAGCLEVLSNMKEKLHWSQAEVQAKRQQLAEVEVMVARKRELLTRTKQDRNGLQRDNQRLKERRGLLQNRDLLRDFEETVDASERLENHLEDLKSKQAELTFRCGKWRQKPEEPLTN
uniref:Cilia and flagella associated protein 184 n=1 Tax=Fundulus heteroclitus TaxID=8078 RepID=A0A147AXG9_FUNHE